MKWKVLRIAIVLAVLGALAAIPASTQVFQTNSQTTSSQPGGDLALIVLVNRLELSRTQMETLRTTINGLLAQRDVLDQKRAAFEQEMIAFSGTSEELDARLASFNMEMKTARAAFKEQASTAVDTLKETLTMKQGEILMGAFPGLMGLLNAVSARQAANSVEPTAVGSASGVMMQRGQNAVIAIGGQKPTAVTTPGTGSASALMMAQPSNATGVAMSQSCPMMQGSQMGTMMQSGQASPVTMAPGTASTPTVPQVETQSTTGVTAGESTETQSTQDSTGIVGKLQTMAERIRDRIAGRLGSAAATSASSTAATPSTTAAGSMCPMGMTMPTTGSVVSAQVETASSEVGNVDDFGTLTISLSGDVPAVSMSAASGGQRLVDWLERVVHVLELKLAAMS